MTSTCLDGSSGLTLGRRTANAAQLGPPLLFLFCMGLSLIFAGWHRPLWIDEVLHFAVGSMSLPEVLRTIDYTSNRINHGQTGFYILVDWALLQLTGANAFALRLPSLVSLLMLLWCSAWIIRIRGFGLPWQLVAILSVCSHFYLVSFAAEARPYMPLAASAVAMVTYFLADLETRRRLSMRIIGAFGLYFGALMQAYWILFLIVAVAFAFLVRNLDECRCFRASDLVRLISPVVTVPAVFLYLLITLLTWFRDPPQFDYAPFEMIGGLERAQRVFWAHHIETWSPRPVWIVLGLALLMVLGVERKLIRALIAPVVLVFTGLVSSAFLSLISISNGYWLFERQWVGGIALCAVGLSWLSAVLWTESERFRALPRTLSAALVISFISGTVMSVSVAFENQQIWREQSREFAISTATPNELFADPSDASVVYAANVNASRREPVWPQFTDWYEDQAGLRLDSRSDTFHWSTLLPGLNGG